MTAELRQAAEILKIDLMDHVVVGDGRSVSLRQIGCFGGVEAKESQLAAERSKQPPLTACLSDLENVVTKTMGFLFLQGEQLSRERTTGWSDKEAESFAAGLSGLAADMANELRRAYNAAWDQLRAASGADKVAIGAAAGKGS